jgi:predicted outer membrane repeat protein
VSDNQAPNGFGGGINVQAGSVVVVGGSHVDANSAFNEGGIRVGRVKLGRIDAVRVVGGSTVNGNSSTALVDPPNGDFGGGGIAVESTGNVFVSASQVSDNHTVGMYSGGIVVSLGSVAVTDGSQITGNTNRGPGGGIAANFGGAITVSGHSQVSGNTGAAIGGGIVNFSGPLGSVRITGGSQVDNNTLTNEETIGQAIAVFLEYIRSQPNLGSAAAAAARAAHAAEERLTNPFLLVGGGGIGTLAAPISVTGGSEVNGNFCGRRDRSRLQTTGLGGGVFSVLGQVAIDHAVVEYNQAPYGAGGGIYNAFNLLTLDHATVNGNSAAGDGGGIWNGGVLFGDDSTITNNTAGGDGGGLFNAAGGRARIVDSAFTGNSAEHTGGGIANAGHLTLIDTLFADNTPDDVGQV